VHNTAGSEPLNSSAKRIFSVSHLIRRQRRKIGQGRPQEGKSFRVARLMLLLELFDVFLKDLYASCVARIIGHTVSFRIWMVSAAPVKRKENDPKDDDSALGKSLVGNRACFAHDKIILAASARLVKRDFAALGRYSSG
jgi:hypothetical protein